MERRDALLAALAAVSHHPTISCGCRRTISRRRRLSDRLRDAGAFRADVSGAGPCVYGLFDGREQADRAALALITEDQTWVVSPVRQADATGPAVSTGQAWSGLIVEHRGEPALAPSAPPPAADRLSASRPSRQSSLSLAFSPGGSSWRQPPAPLRCSGGSAGRKFFCLAGTWLAAVSGPWSCSFPSACCSSASSRSSSLPCSRRLHWPPSCSTGADLPGATEPPPDLPARPGRRVHSASRFTGAWPSGKATGFGPVIPGSNPGAPANVPTVSESRPKLAAVVMAGGRGTRMRSATPKHLHPILGRRMVDWIVEAARPLEPDSARRRRLTRHGGRVRRADDRGAGAGARDGGCGAERRGGSSRR